MLGLQLFAKWVFPLNHQSVEVLAGEQKATECFSALGLPFLCFSHPLVFGQALKRRLAKEHEDPSMETFDESQSANREAQISNLEAEPGPLKRLCAREIDDLQVSLVKQVLGHGTLVNLQSMRVDPFTRSLPAVPKRSTTEHPIVLANLFHICATCND